MSLSAVQKALAGVGALFIAATWVFVVVARPTDWSSVGASSQALITLGGYVTGAVLLLVATVPALPARLVSMIPVALVLNIVVGQIIGSVGIPLPGFDGNGAGGGVGWSVGGHSHGRVEFAGVECF